MLSTPRMTASEQKDFQIFELDVDTGHCRWFVTHYNVTEKEERVKIARWNRLMAEGKRNIVFWYDACPSN